MDEKAGKANERSLFVRVGMALPVVFSLTFLVLAYLAFATVICVDQALLRRHNVPLFVSQLVICSLLLAMTVTSYLAAITTRPLHPDQSLAPDLERTPPQRMRSLLHNAPVTATSCAESSRGDDIPMRFMRNSQWVTTRGTKSRPSPLPLKTATPQRREHAHNHAAVSTPSVLNTISPLAPHTPAAAGQDPADAAGTARLTKLAEGAATEASSASGTSHGRRVSPVMAKDSTGGARYCRKCDAWKPDRAHHCSFCRRCVLKMDHHCPWINNCVGYHNYKQFILFVTYGALSAVYIAISAGFEVLSYWADPAAFAASSTDRPTPETCVGSTCTAQVDLEPVAMIVLTVCGIFFALAVGSLACYHWWLASTNKTMLEDMSHAYPTALLDEQPSPTPRALDLPASSASGTSGSSWKPSSHLTRHERLRLRNQARAINVYDLGISRNLFTILVGEPAAAYGRISSEDAGDGCCQAPRWTRRHVLRAMWPLFKAATIEGGNGFEYDEAKLRELKRLTKELRVAEEAEAAEEEAAEQHRQRQRHPRRPRDPKDDNDDDDEMIDADDEYENEADDDGYRFDETPAGETEFLFKKPAQNNSAA